LFAPPPPPPGTLAARRDPRGLVMAGLGIGLAIAAKSLIAGVPALALAPWWLGPLRMATLRTRLWAGAALAGVALPYYALLTALHGQQFLRAHFGVSLARRATASLGLGMQDGPASYLLWVPSGEGLLTATWLLLGSVGALLAGLRLRRAELVLLGGYALTVFALMSWLATRLPHYILPAYPAAALGIAGLYVELTARTGFAQRALAPLLAPALGLCAVLEARGHPGGYQYLLQRSTSRDLGLVARRVAAAGQAIYAYEWYGPAIAYYAERPVVMLTESEHARDLLGAMMPTKLVPPAPEPRGSPILIVAEPEALAAAPWLHVDEVLASSPPAILARARTR
jgi:4-amino-4-deoxy-L-arabinose transferase-like glycosyltransferase